MTEFRPGRFEILPPIIKNLIIINSLVFLAQYTMQAKGSHILEDLFALHTWQSPLFRPWQFLTHLFMHGDFFHILFNMFALWSFGSILENLWGQKRFLIFYLSCGFGAAFCHMLVLYFENQQLVNVFNSLSPGEQQYYYAGYTAKLNEATLGASGAVFGCLAAFGYLFPNSIIIGFPIFIPIKAKWAVLLYIGIELFAALKSSAGDNIAHVAHLGGALVGFLLVYYWNRTNKRRFY
ncbi:MAG: rhomboid family intrarane serine protease [Chitinophagaceae bacterium]|nr:rhomboid family intrarane serine protease [Chitinophagaceae bacterium]